jgi:hypothetical protein
MAQNDQLIHLGPWPKGMNNALADFELPLDVLRDIRNADVLDSGFLRRRKGYSQVRAGVGVHSLFYHRPGKFMVWVEGGDLVYGANPTVVTPTVLASGFNSTGPVYYDLVDNWLYYSDGSRKGKINALGQHYPWGITVPASYVVSPSGVGGFKAGKYIVCCTFVLATGEESAPGPVYQIDVPEGGGISVTGIPVPSEPLISRVFIYVSDWNSEQLYLHTDIAAGTTSAALSKLLTTSGAALRGAVGTEPMPAGKFVTLFAGRMFVAIGKFVMFSEPLYYGITRRSTNFYGFGSDVTMMVDTLDGIYIASDKTYFISNAGSKEATQREVLAYGAIPSAIVRAVDNIEGNVAWFSERGFVIGAPGGQVKNVMDDAIAPKAYTKTRAFWRAQNGIKQLVAVASGGGSQDDFVASDFIDAELVRGTPQ